MCDIVDAAARCRDVPVDERDRLVVAADPAVDGVLRREVVVADHLGTVDALAAASASQQRRPDRQVVERPDKFRHLHETRIGPERQIGRRGRHAAVDELDDLATRVVVAEKSRCAGPLGRGEPVEQRAHVR